MVFRALRLESMEAVGAGACGHSAGAEIRSRRREMARIGRRGVFEIVIQSSLEHEGGAARVTASFWEGLERDFVALIDFQGRWGALRHD
jgi:hypothetical protein